MELRAAERGQEAADKPKRAGNPTGLFQISGWWRHKASGPSTRRSIPSKLLYFPDENHWVLKPANSILWHETVITWLDQWVK
ncbi:MAG: prolyl oligopeptidase family serine peptidase [Candidatus Aminicenantales bacterium]